MRVLEERIALMVRLGNYFEENGPEWQEAVELAERQNGWFTPEFIRLAVQNITNAFLRENLLREWTAAYPDLFAKPSTATALPAVGLVMAGNIPLVGFHDFLCIYLAGFRLRIKLSSKDTLLWEHIFRLLGSWDPEFAAQVSVEEMLKGCDAYIATGSNNSARHFDYYFRKFPHIIRRNRTSVAVLDGSETTAELALLADDVCSFFGLGCRNVTKIFVPEGYNFETLLPAFNSYTHFNDHNKYRNNYDFQLALFLLNKVEYMTNSQLLLVPGESPYAAISVLHYAYYTDRAALMEQLAADDRLQCITTSQSQLAAYPQAQAFGANQAPGLSDYADGVDTMAFLASLV
ncbi:acyl-CoA reductase [Taibaiella chishuiensis]|uniref:Acyl-CoA reductase LuxC n=1 Tax=Taibaiella chishuiensis TaxID=1434707 RepID=A0A2P8CYU3_9BACT|nr:acyl-CoA reductase [Taibaiella chishuiensis]PSK90142.1 hypothetical protein B0I18_109148 [Taibaiella chishuiensis]